MQPPEARARKEGRRSSSSGASSSRGSSAVGRRHSSSGGGQQQLTPAAGAGVGGGSVAVPTIPADETRTVLSGSLSRCSPVFSSSSDTVFCACSSSVLGVSVETGEELLSLTGHSKDVTAMITITLPPGLYSADGAASGDGGGGSGFAAGGAAPCERLLTSSLDGTLRLWDVSADVLSLEGETERCLRVLNVGMPVYHLFLGRQDSSGTAVDVIVVTKEGTSSLHGFGQKESGEGGATKLSTPAPDGGVQAMDADGDEDEGDVTSEEDDSSDDDDSDDGDAVEIDSAATELQKGGGVSAAGQGKKDGSEKDRVRKGGGAVVERSGSRKRGGGATKSDQRLFDWQAVRYSLAKGVAQTVLLVSKQQYRWKGTTAPRSPVTNTNTTGADARRRGGWGACPVLLTADGRVVTAVDAATGDRAVLVTGMAPVRSMVVGGDGETLVTGHLDGSMSQWHELTDRLGVAFGVSGYEALSGGEPSTDMHWHAHPVRCMALAPDGVQLFSGGEEAVLVQWNLSKGTKAFLPRLGGPLQGLAVAPGQEHAVVTTRDNALSLVGLAAWDVMWQMRGLSLSRPHPPKISSPAESVARARQALKLTMGPRGGVVACNGRAGHVQFYNVATNCLEASAEVVRFNRTTSSKSWRSDQLAKKTAAAGAAGAASLGPVVEHVAFSSDGKRMVAVASRASAFLSSPSLSFWRKARGADPFGSSNGYTGSYTGARNTRGGVGGRGRGGGGGGGGGTSGHWEADTNVENPHGPGKTVVALEYHPKEDVVATAAEQDGAFNLWGLRRTNTALESLAAAATKAGGGGGGERGEGTPEVHWACSLSVRYKEGLAATGVSFCSDGSVLAVAYAPAAATGGGGHDKEKRQQRHSTGHDKKKRQQRHSTGQGVITLWSLETVTLLSTLLPPRTRDVRLPSSSSLFSSSPLKSLGFIAGSGRVFAAGSGFAAVWDMVSPELTPLWEYRARVLAAATADTASVFRSGKAGVSVKGRGVGDVALCVDAASLSGDKDGRVGRGSVVLLLNSGDPTPLHTWRLPHDTPTCLRLLLGGGGGTADSPEGVLCLTRRGELLMLSVASSSYEGVRDGKTVLAPRQVASGLGVVRMKGGASAPALHLSAASKRALLAVDLAASDPALASGGTGVGGKRLRVSAMDDGEEEEEEDDGHAGGREALLRSGQRASDVLDPSTINLAPVPDIYEAFMSTLLKPAPQQQQQQQRLVGGVPFSAAVPTLAGGLDKRSKGRGKKGKRGRGAVTSPPSVVDEGLLSVLAKNLRA